MDSQELQPNPITQAIPSTDSTSTTPQSPPKTPPQLSEKKSDLMNIVTIFLLFFLPIFGFISLWVWSTWSKKTKWIITILYFLVVFAFIPVIILITLNPQNQFSQANNTQRRMNITIIADGLRQYKAEYMNENPSVITSSPTEISKSGADLCSLLVPQFIPALPVDPMLNSPDIEEIDCESEYNTGYTVVLNPDGTITVSAPHAENEATISVSR